MNNLGKFSSALVIASVFVLSGCSASSDASEKPDEIEATATVAPSEVANEESQEVVSVVPNYDVPNPMGLDMAQIELQSNVVPAAYVHFTSGQIQDGARFGLNWITQMVYIEDLYKKDREMEVTDAIVLKDFVQVVHPEYIESTFEDMKVGGANKVLPVPSDEGKVITVEGSGAERKINPETHLSYKNVPASIQWETPRIEYRESTKNGEPLVTVIVKAGYPMIHDDGTEATSYVEYIVSSRVNPDSPTGWDVNGWKWNFVDQNA